MKLSPLQEAVWITTVPSWRDYFTSLRLISLDTKSNFTRTLSVFHPLAVAVKCGTPREIILDSEIGLRPMKLSPLQEAVWITTVPSWRDYFTSLRLISLDTKSNFTRTLSVFHPLAVAVKCGTPREIILDSEIGPTVCEIASSAGGSVDYHCPVLAGQFHQAKTDFTGFPILFHTAPSVFHSFIATCGGSEMRHSA